MLKRILLSLFLLSFSALIHAENNSPRFVLLPNVKTNYLLSTDAKTALRVQQQAMDLVTRILGITPNSPYREVRIRFIYGNDTQVKALIVYLLSSQYKSIEIVRINLNDGQTYDSLIRNYQIQPEDLDQAAYYAKRITPKCPDQTVQFVIGNNFTGDRSVEKEVQTVFETAKAKGYNPFMMNTNNPNGPQPTVQAYENWLSCPNVKGFYNESHGWEQGIALTDGEFMYSHVNNDLVNKLKQNVVLLDSCLTFHDPLLNSMVHKEKGNSQQYIAGFISLPFGSSERTARCFWNEAFNHQELNQGMISTCAIKYHLDPKGFQIAGNGEKYLNPPQS